MKLVDIFYQSNSDIFKELVLEDAPIRVAKLVGDILRWTDNNEPVKLVALIRTDWMVKEEPKRFSNAKIGDKVICSMYGKGEIIEIDTSTNREEFAIGVKFNAPECGRNSYTIEGKQWNRDEKTVLDYYKEPECEACKLSEEFENEFGKMNTVWTRIGRLVLNQDQHHIKGCSKCTSARS